jgi:hypothetical protein
MNGTGNPHLSVVVAIVSDTAGRSGDVSLLEKTLRALARQIDAPPMEIVVPYYPGISGIEKIQARFPDVVLIRVDDLKTFTGRGNSREHHDELRSRGLAAARAPLIALLEDHARPDPHWCARLVEAHQKSFAAVGGAIENGVDRPLNWAVYFCDFGKYQNPVPAGETTMASDANVSYKRAALESIKPVWQEAFHETSVNWALRSRGEKLALSPAVVVYQDRGVLRLAGALRERFTWGRSYAASVLPGVLLMRMTANVVKKGRSVGPFLRALPYTVLLTVSWSWGEFAGYVTGRT